MPKKPFLASVVLGLALALLGVPARGANDYLSPTALAADQDGKSLYVACATAGKVLQLDTESRKVIATIQVPAHPSGLALAAAQHRLYVTCGGAEGVVCIVDTTRMKVVGQIRAGHTPTAPVLSPDGKQLFVCNRFNDDVSVINLDKRKELRRIPVEREPVAAAITPDGKSLLVANMLPNGRADLDYVAAVVSVIDLADGKVVKKLQLPNGSGSLNDIRISPDGKYAVLTHILARFHLPASQVDRGWMNANAQTIIDTAKMEIVNTVLLDNPESGAANPWGVGWSADGARLVVAHAGTHEISVIDFPALIAKLKSVPQQSATEQTQQYGSVVLTRDDVSHDLTFLGGTRQRLKLPAGDLGPRAVAVSGNIAWIADYFSDSLSAVDVSCERLKVESIALGAKTEMDVARRGELNFHDARLCFQTWQSCASCHPGDGRVDALNWDLLNDGIGNPKNNKSLLLAHRTPPAMSLGIRDTAEIAVRSGIRFILFTQQPDEVAASIDEYLKALKPVASPRLVNGVLSSKARRGEKIFKRAGCIECHPPGLYTDLQHYDVGTTGKYDQPMDRFDTPTLVEIWRTAPYLHDGSALTVRDVVTARNKDDQHGKTSNLSESDIDDLCEFLLSL